jgi:hydroxypyruvate isomerase
MGAYRQTILEGIDVAAANGIPNVFLSAGSRRADLDYAQGAENSVAFCNAVKGRAEEKGVTLVIEFLNSKGFAAPAMSMFDHMAWGVDVCKRVNSPRVKILYDIYHAQIMDGFIVQTLRDNFQYIGHIHTGGVPGRHELDDTQELNWHFIAQAIADLNYKGFVTHEWTPTPGRNYLDGLKQALDVMKV